MTDPLGVLVACAMLFCFAVVLSLAIYWAVVNPIANLVGSIRARKALAALQRAKEVKV